MAKLFKVSGEVIDLQPTDRAKGFTSEELEKRIGDECGKVELRHLKGDYIIAVDKEGFFKAYLQK